MYCRRLAKGVDLDCVTRPGRAQVICGDAELLQWSVHRKGTEITVALTGEVDISNEAALGVALAEVVSMNAARIAIDLAGVSYLDSSGIRCLLNTAKHAEAAGSELVVRRPVGIVLRVLEICGVALLLRCSDGDESEDQ
jgi:anti-sigma B factor antagonist